MKVMFDINVILDIIAQREPFFKQSQAAYLRVLEQGDDAYVAVHAIATIYYILGGATTRAHRAAAMDWLLEAFHVAPAGEAEVKLARTLGFADFEDALVVACAQTCGCSTILTRNVKDFQHSPLSVATPAKFIGD